MENSVAAGPANPGKSGITPQDLTGGGSAGYVAMWTSSTNLADSRLYQSASGGMGIGTKSPTGKFQVNQGGTEGAGVFGDATSATGTTTGVSGTSASSAGFGVAGEATATSGDNAGVSGSTASSTGTGVLGEATATSGANAGLVGTTSSTAGIGVQGDGVSGAVGVWRDAANSGVGVPATSDTGSAIYAVSGNDISVSAFIENTQTTTPLAVILETYNAAYNGFCDIFANGNLTCSGSMGGNALVNQTQDVALYLVQAAENWMEDAGSGQLQNGVAVIQLEAPYVQIANTEMDYDVLVTPKGDCNGLFVSNQKPGSFEVHELNGGAVAFDYRITARRKSFENLRLAGVPKPSDAIDRTRPGRTRTTP